MAWALVFGLVLASFYTGSHSQDTVTVKTKRGTIVGLRFNPNPATNVSYDAFLGIPYGRIPARFQVAVPRPPWSTAKDTKADGPACPQPALPYNEDCLYMNVFTPLGSSSTNNKLPVMAFIHGSGYFESSSSSLMYGPDFLVDEQVILVTFNYRLGAAGFLTLGSKVAPGNLGLTDTLLALQWIQEEITVFGGDPAKVTLFGESAGSAAVISHYLSPQSTDLFVRAIAQSGSALADWAVLPMTEGVRRSKVLAQAVGCDPSENDTTIISCLQKADIKDIVGNQSIPLPSDDVISGSNGLRFVPVLDSYLTADLPFFNDTLSNLMEKALARGKPLMNGFNTHDGIVKWSLDDAWKQAEFNLVDFIPRANRSIIDDSTRTRLQQDIQKRYFPDTFDQDKVLDILNLYTDTIFSYPAIQVSKYFKNLTYGYLFNYYGSWSWDHSSVFPYRLMTVDHGAELPYIFYATNVSRPLDSCSLNTANLAMKTQLVSWWTTFAKNGTPVTDISWKVVADGGYLVIDTTTSTRNVTEFESQYYEFWSTIAKSSGFNLPTTILHFLPSLLILVLLF
uniref:Carboxylic ester hydrolase n=1 Tax=Homalodisca liturata TaxID=320908 RepID=A0A1B6I346_9HEMI